MKNLFKNSRVIGLCRMGGLLLGASLAWAISAQGQVAFSDDFTRTNDPAPITPWLMPGAATNIWTVTGGTMQGGPDATSSYGYVYVTNLVSSNASFQAQIKFSSTSAYGGGVGGYVNTGTGAHYAAWIYPDASLGGNGIRLIKFTNWTAFGYQGTNFGFMAETGPMAIGTTLHTLKLSIITNVITVALDGTNVISTTDVEAQKYTSGAMSLDMYTDLNPYTFNADNVVETAVSFAPIAVADSYSVTAGKILNVAAPGVLINDTGGSGPLTAVLGTTTAHGTLTLTNNGGFKYTPTGGFTGTDTFTYRANDGVTNSALVTNTIAVNPDHPPVANDDSYTMLPNTTLIVAPSGILANDTDADADSLTAVLVSTTTNGLLTLTNNGGFSYAPTNNFSGVDTFTYKANDGTSNSTTAATVTLSVLPTSTLFFDSFMGRSTLPPWVVQSGSWAVTGGALVSGVNSGYAYAYLTNIWTNYSVQAQVSYTAGSFGGGIGGRFNSGTGAHYGAWVYPESSPGGGPALRLVKFSDYTTFGYLGTNGGFMGMTNLTGLGGVGTGVHTVKLCFVGTQIAVYYDGTQVLSVADADAVTLPTGGVSADEYANSPTDEMTMGNVIVSPLANSDSYTVDGGSTLTVTAPGVLANDTPVFTGSLTASQVTGPAHGSLTLNANGSFVYTPTVGFSGQDSFTYQANDGATNVGTATVNINVIFTGPSSLVFAENFDGVVAPALPGGWTTVSNGVEAKWVTTTASNNTSPNAAFVPDALNIGLSELITPTIALPAGPCQLTFENNYNLEINSTNSSDAFDGGVLEIKIGGGAFTDVITAGGSFITGGYNSVVDAGYGNVLSNRAAWSGNSHGYITTTLDLPPAASGQSVQLKWRCGTDNGNGKTGWWIDTISISNCPTSVCWNTAPAFVSQISNVTVDELTPVTVTNAAADTDSPSQTLTYTLPTAPSGASIGLHTGIITWTSTQNQSPSTNLFVTRVVDNGSPALSATNSFNVIIREVNVAPTLAAQSPRTNFGLATFTITNAATETNIHATTTGYSLSGQPTGMTITSGGVITWTPIASQVPNSYTITTIATNRDTFDTVNPILTATNSFLLTAAAVHNGPTLSSVSVKTVNELVQLTVTNTATDMDVPVLPLTYYLTNNSPTNANISGTGVITWTPSQTQSPAVTNITTVVTDGSKSATNSFQVTVKEINVAPTPPTITPQTVNELNPLSVTNTATESNIHSVVTNYTIVGPLAGMSITTNGIFSWTPAQTQSPTNATVTIVVANTNQFDTVNPVLKATNSFTVAVKEINVAPVSPVIGPQTVNELAQLTVTNTASETNIHSVMTNYTIVAPLAGMNITTNGIFTWTPAQTQSPTNTTVTIVAANTNQFDTVNPVLKATNSFTVAVNEVNVAPTLPLIGPQTVNEQMQLTVNDAATETNIHSVTTGYTIVTPSLGMNITSNGLFTWTPSQGQSPGNYFVTIVASNNNPFDAVNPILTATNSFTVAVKEVNIAPSVAPIGVQTVNELEPLTVTNMVTEPNDHAVTTGFGLVGALSGMNVDSNGVFTWTPSQTQSHSTNLISVVVTNSDTFDTVNPVLKTTNTFNVVVNEVNQPPTLPVISPQTVNEQVQLTVNDAATETNIYAVTTGYTIVSPLLGMNVTSNGLFTWTPDQSQSPGNYTVTVVAANSNQFDALNPVLMATNSFTVAVKEVNIAPLVAAIGLQTVNELTPLTVTNIVTEPNDHAVTTGFGLVGALSGMNVDSNGVFTWTPSQAQSHSTNLVSVVVTNSDTLDTVNPILTATNTFNVVVNEVNQAPILPVISPQTVNELVQLSVSDAATETNINSVTTGYGIVGPLLGMNVDSNGLFTWTPGQTQSPGNYTVTIVATNNNAFDAVNPTLTATNSFTVAVKEVNVAPTLPVISPQTVNEQVQLTVNDAATETNIHAVITGYTIMSPLLGMNITSGGLFTWTPSQAQSPGNYTVTIVVSNSDVLDLINPILTATNSFTVAVKEVNIAPSVAPIGLQTVNELQPLTVTNVVTEPNVHAVTTGFGLVGALSGMNVDSNGVFTWTPSQTQSHSTNLITVVVTNSDTFDTVNPILTATNTFNVVVKEVNVAPTLPVIGPQTVAVLNLLTVTNTATETNINAVTTGYGLIGAPSGVAISANGVITWTPQTAGTNTITTVVTNSDAFDPVNSTLMATNSFQVVVTGVIPPPNIQSVGISSGAIVITWSAVDGLTYQAQYKSNLTDTNWSPIVPNVTASGPTASITNAIANPQQFFRILLVP